MKQINIGIPLYADSNNGKFPDRTVNNKNSQFVWVGAQSESLNSSDPLPQDRPITIELGLDITKSQSSVVTCPSARGRQIQSKRGASYGVNTWRIPNGISFKNSEHTGSYVTVQHLSGVKNPSRMISFVESSGFNNAFYGQYNESHHNKPFIYNFSRVDGSAVKAKISSLQHSSEYWTFNNEL